MKEIRGSVPAAQALTFTASLEVNDGVGCVVSGSSAWNFKDFAEHPVRKVVHPLQPSNRPSDPAKKGSRVSKGHVCACERSNSSVAKSLSPFPVSFPRRQNILTPPKTS